MNNGVGAVHGHTASERWNWHPRPVSAFRGAHHGRCASARRDQARDELRQVETSLPLASASACRQIASVHLESSTGRLPTSTGHSTRLSPTGLDRRPDRRQQAGRVRIETLRFARRPSRSVAAELSAANPPDRESFAQAAPRRCIKEARRGACSRWMGMSASSERCAKRLRLLDRRRPPFKTRRIDERVAGGVESEDIVVGDEPEITKMRLGAGRACLRDNELEVDGSLLPLGKSGEDDGRHAIETDGALQPPQRVDDDVVILVAPELVRQKEEAAREVHISRELAAPVERRPSRGRGRRERRAHPPATRG